MDKFRAFLKTSLIGGFVVILPVAIIIFLFTWLFRLVTGLIEPLTNYAMKFMGISMYQRILADIMVISTIILACFVLGAFVRTKLGTYLHRVFEEKILKVAPGYNLIKETVMQFLGGKKAPFSSVAIVQLFGSETETYVSAFITDTHSDGSYTVFIPTGPNPTSGNICHVSGDYVFPVDAPVEDTMRSIISCGAGSSRLIDSMIKKRKERQDNEQGGIE
jgi:uncharacterized membrane protein